MHALTDHAESFLQGFLEGAADGHHLAHRLHRRAKLALHTVELGEVPAGYFYHHVVEGRLEEGTRGLRHRVLQFEEAVAQSQLGGDECQGIARSLRGQCRRTAQTGIHLDDAIVLAVGVEGILHVTLTDDADVTDNLDGQCAQLVILRVGQRLARGHHD